MYICPTRNSSATARSSTRNRDSLAGPLQPPQHLEIGLSGGRDEILIGNVGDRDETDMTILAVECAAGQRFVEVLKPVGRSAEPNWNSPISAGLSSA